MTTSTSVQGGKFTAEEVAGLAHDLRNLVTSIHGHVALQLETVSDPELLESLGAIQLAVDEIGRHLEGMYKQATGRVRPHDPFNLAALARRMAEVFQTWPAAGSVELHGSDQVTCCGDEEEIGRAMINLLRNAREAAGPDGSITLQWCRDRDRVWFEVIDTGPGLPPEGLSAFVEPFKSSKGDGRGLGLWIASEVARAHGGRLSGFNHMRRQAGSEGPSGAVIRFELPQ